MKYSELLPGAKLDIKVLQQVKRKDSSDEKVFLTTVLDVTEKDEIIINMPQVGGKMVILPENIRYELLFTTQSGIYRAEGQVVSKGKKDNLYVLVVKINEELSKIQRREFFRFEVLVPMIYTTIGEDVANLPTQKEVLIAVENKLPNEIDKGTGTILDISGGGLRFISVDRLDKVEYLTVRFQLGDGTEAKIIEVVCRLLNSSYKEDARKYEHRVKFIVKDTSTRETIIKYIFDEERRIRKKSLG